jgi:hypothetical protein
MDLHDAPEGAAEQDPTEQRARPEQCDNHGCAECEAATHEREADEPPPAMLFHGHLSK